MMTAAGLLIASAIGCIWLAKVDPHGIAAVCAATLALSPLMTLGLMAIGLAS